MSNPNTSCLEGMRCPSQACGSYGPFSIVASVTVTATDEGAEDTESGYEWDDDSSCDCKDCGYAATVKDFREPLDEKEWLARASVENIARANDLLAQIARMTTEQEMEHGGADEDFRAALNNLIEAARTITGINPDHPIVYCVVCDGHCNCNKENK